MYCVASFAPAGELNRQLYESVEGAKRAMTNELRRLRALNEGDADEINGVLDEIEAVTADYYTIFTIQGRQWCLWWHVL